MAADQLCQDHSELSVPQACVLALARKNPSAARLLRVWQTTEEFMEQQARLIAQHVGGAGRGVKRAVYTITSGDPPSGIYQADLPGVGRLELFVRPEENGTRALQTIQRLSDEQVQRLKSVTACTLISAEGDKPGKHDEYPCTLKAQEPEMVAPYQVITTSPNMLLAMVPADRALDLVERMRADYACEFGKVQGRLPFHVGLVYMDQHYPMFAALDTARRLVETFERAAEQQVEATLTEKCAEKDVHTLNLSSERFGEWRWEVPGILGDGSRDRYHPYFLVKKGKGLDKRPMSLLGPGGRWVHVADLHTGDTLAFQPNLFDYVFLDTVSRRLDAQLQPNSDRRPHDLLGARSPRPYLLEGQARLREVWEAICKVPGMSETRLSAAAQLLAAKWRAWQVAQAPAGAPAPAAYAWLARQTAALDFAGKPEIERSMIDGTFFDVVEIYRNILKIPIKPEDSTERRSEDERATD
jgi:hypothetical protein